MSDLQQQLKLAAQDSKAWPYLEAKALIKRLDRAEKTKSDDDKSKPVVFQTGYGPSGLPHIGTFGEVARTTMVRHAFELLTGRKTRLICFSDDMDGFRKVPTNLPNQDMLATQLGLPLSQVKDPFGTNKSFAEHNNQRLQEFLDSFGFDYEFMSATDCYKSGMMDDTLLLMLEKFDDIMAIILPTLGAERQATYSPFLPICPRTGIVLQVPVVARDLAQGTISYNDPETAELITLPVTGGHCKMQWKADWAMRWAALGVDYEMAGKDLSESVILSSRIVRVLGVTPPVGFSYELFLDEDGKKISKSKGNGLTMEEWLRYATPESLSYYMYQSPRKAKRLFFDVIPKAVDDYITFLGKYDEQSPKEKISNAAYHVHNGNLPHENMPISFALLLNLVSVANVDDKATLWGFIRNYVKPIDGVAANADAYPLLDRLISYALTYYEDFVKPTKQFRSPTEQERAALEDLAGRMGKMADDLSPSDIMTEVFAVGKEHGFENLRDWFKALYEILLGQSQGPRFGGFAALYGIKATKSLIEKALSGASMS
ncbi:MAG: lysine--tRNA ligase [Rhizobiales bacterium]|nr:lysine--tRNA ligase [Hyphomicrobiales bacterium]NRB14380.1 lysine--tRNA ligase [Hyphomicrobiales bacterium]